MILVVVFVLVRAGVFHGHGVHSDPWRAAVGLALFVLGLAFAVWARVHIGRNWGTPMTQKNEPELVTSGPYRFVRHPIYSGILLGGLGTAIALSWSGWPLSPRRHLLRLQRDRRGALPGGAVPGRLPRVQALDEDARAVRPLGRARW